MSGFLLCTKGGDEYYFIFNAIINLDNNSNDYYQKW